MVDVGNPHGEVDRIPFDACCHEVLDRMAAGDSADGADRYVSDVLF